MGQKPNLSLVSKQSADVISAADSSMESAGFIQWVKQQPQSDFFEILLQQQAKQVRADELKFFFASPAWEASKNVLEIGFGTTTPIGSQARYFPDKQYTQLAFGLDYHKSEGRFKSSISSIFSELSGLPKRSFDFIILRLVLQHLPDSGLLMESLSNLLTPNGNILIIEAYDKLTRFVPAIPTLGVLYDKLSFFQSAKGGNRQGSEELESTATTYGFDVISSEKVPSIVRLTEEKQVAAETMVLVTEFMERALSVRVDQEKLVEEFQAWSHDPTSWGQLGLHFLLLGKRS